MNVLVACEFSGVVRDAFIKRGHNAVSCDMLPTEKPGPHIRADILKVLEMMPGYFDLMIAHPPCTHLSGVCGNVWPKKFLDGRMIDAMNFFKALYLSDIPRKAIENPTGIINSIMKPTQIIEPFQFGHPTRKRTCLWLQNLSPLKPTQIVEPIIFEIGMRYGKPCNYYFTREAEKKVGYAKRAHERSRTFPGIAAAMAEQWGGL
jgi:hypothetical protein